MKNYLAICILFLIGFNSFALNSEIEPDIITDIKPELNEDKIKLRNIFIGKWSSTQPTENGRTRETIIERFPDSRYIIIFKFYDDMGVLLDAQQEFGFWGVSGGIYFTMFRGFVENDQFFEVDPTDPYNYDTYKIISFSKDKLVYKSLSTGNKFIYKRVE